MRLARSIPASLLVLLSAACAVDPSTSDADDAYASSEDALRIDVPTTATVTAKPGQGFNSVLQEFRGQCVTGTVSTIGAPEAQLALDQELSEERTKEMLELKTSASGRYGIYSGDAKAQFARAAAKNRFSINMVFGASYRLGTRHLDDETLRFVVPKTAPDWNARCGDMVVTDVVTGGKLMLLYRIDFASEAEKVAFQASGSFSAAKIAEADVSFKRTLESFRGRASIHVEAYQAGGDVARLGRVVGGTQSGALATATCSIENLTQCSTMLANGLRY
ncbi:hypothetical protein EON77_21195, partial [bacterium]